MKNKESDLTSKEELFIKAVGRINRYLILMGIYYLVCFALKTRVDKFLFLLALTNMAVALLSHKHLEITNRLSVELDRAKTALRDCTENPYNVQSQR
tara:strand:- start:343 stop:633 length:291 start_codon:yes stop_codon:yes gene_type:complete